MNYSKAITSVLLGTEKSDYSKQDSEEIRLVVEDIFNQIELKCKVSQEEEYLRRYQEVLELRSLIRNLTSDLYLAKLMSNHYREQAIKSINQI